MWAILFPLIALAVIYAVTNRGDIPVEELILKDIEKVKESNERFIQSRRVE